MQKRMAQFFLALLLIEQFFLLMPMEVKAYTSSSETYYSRNECDKKAYELAYANSDKSLTKKECYDTYDKAKKAMDESKEDNSDNLVILERKNNQTKIIDAKYAILDINKNDSSQNTNVYIDDTTNSAYTYINGNSSYGGVEALYLGININNRRAKMKISGITGWLKEAEYKIVPLVWVSSSNKYIVTDDTITHYLTTDMYSNSSNKWVTYTLGPKPTQLAKGTYYSYDGIYFYRDLKLLTQDEREGVRTRSVNKDNPYYNYYMYLPHHSKTTYSGSDIDEYLNNLYDKVKGYNYTNLYGSGYAFYNVQENQGINALMMLSVARNESAEGRSKFSTSRNNLFGHNAVDSNPNSASSYTSIRKSILAHATDFIGYGYAFASDWRFYGSHLGNKLMGANVKYASDPYWGEKAASYYYAFDASNGMSDYNYYQLAIKSKDGIIYPSYEPKSDEKYRILTPGEDASDYNYQRNGSPVIIVEEVKGDTVNGSDVWYKIISDANINSNHQFVPNSVNVKYDWNTNYVYVPASYYTKINNTSIKNVDSITNYEEKGYTYEAFESGSESTPQVAMIKENGTRLYTDPLLKIASGRTWNKGQYVVVFEKAYDGNKSLKSYQVSATYQKGFREWITPTDISFTKMKYGKVNMTKVHTYANVRTSTSTSSQKLNPDNGGLADGTYVVILEQKTVSGVPWVKIDYDGTLGWVIQKDADQEIEIHESTLQNNAPVIKASNQTIAVGSTFDPKKGVTATDTEDGNITSRIQVVDNKVNTSQKGSYKVTYSVTDSGSLTTTKTITVTVVDRTLKPGLFAYESMKEVGKDTFEVAGFLAVKGTNNKLSDEIKHYFILQNVDTKKEYRFEVTQWRTNYPYEMSDADDTKVYDYSGGWFKGNVNLSSVPEGDYIAYVEVESGIYKAKELYQNLVYGTMPRKAQGANNRGYLFQMNYYTKSRPLDISIRDEGLLANSIPPTTDKMYNLFESIGFKDGKLTIRGTSHNVGIDYSKNKTIERTIVLENIENFKRYSAEVGSITNGDYTVELKVSDGKDKTRAWFDGSIDIANLEKGTYAIYIMTKVDNFADFGELRDLSYRTFKETVSINGKKYTLRRVDSKRFRMELVVS